MYRRGFIALPIILATSIGMSLFGRQLLLPISSSTPAPLQTPSFQKNLEKYLTVEAALLGVVDDMSLYFKDFGEEKEISIQPSKSWIPASTIKAFVVLEAFRQRRLGMIDFNQSISITAQNVVPTELETEDCPRLREGMQATIQQLVECMIIQSDNTAYNTLLDVLDRRNINATLQTLGFTETVVGEKLNLDDVQYAVDLQVPGRQSNTTTVKDFANFFDLLYIKQIPQSDEILDIFKRQKINNMIPALLPEETVVAHKTGEWAPIYHDGGVVYKPNNPFILTMFTNGNDPSVLAKLSRVAYYQDASVVGSDAPQPKKTTGFDDSQEDYTISLTSIPPQSQVLAAETGEKFPQVTAQDLGITLRDVTQDITDLGKIQPARVTPRSLFYGYKRQFDFIQSVVLQLTGRKLDALLLDTSDRLSETRAILRSGNLDLGRRLLAESESSMKQAVDETYRETVNESKLADIKAINDLHYAVLADVARTIDPKKKDQFVDLVYNFYQTNKLEIKQPTQNFLLANPLRQQPIVGTIKDIQHGTITIQFTNGQEKQMMVDDFTPIRQFNQKSMDTTTNNLRVGSKIAVIGQTTNKGTIAPQFILRDLPKEVPDKHEGVVIEINPKKKTLEMINSSGFKETVAIDNETILQGKSTNVSLEGIRAGSYIQVFGQEIESPISITPVPLGGPLTVPKPGSAGAPQTKSNVTTAPTAEPGEIQFAPLPISAPNAGNSGAKGSSSPSSLSSTPETVIHATTVTVTKNSSGKNEHVSRPTAAPKNEKPKKAEPSKPEQPKKKSSLGPVITALLESVYQRFTLLWRLIV